MNITEEDVRSELLEGWEIADKSRFPFKNGAWFDLRKSDLEIGFLPNLNELNFDYKDSGKVTISLNQFLTGNYDLTSISKHYSESEWSAIIGMCESIVRLITGEKQTKKTREDAIKSLLPDCAELINADSYPVVIKCPGYVLKVSSELIWWRHEDDTVPCDWKMCSLDKFNELIHKELYDNLPKISALLTPESTPEKSLEEKVREILTFAADFSELKVTDHSVEFLDNSKPPMWYYVKENEIGYTPADSPKSRNTFTVAEYQAAYGSIPEINAVLPKIAALLHDQEDQPSPTYTELEQRVRELEEDKRLILKDCQKWKDSSEEMDRHIQGWRDECNNKSDRITELEAQLQDYVSPADHEAEVKKCNELLAYESKLHMEQRRIACQYRKWFETEYAKNAGVSQ